MKKLWKALNGKMNEDKKMTGKKIKITVLILIFLSLPSYSGPDDNIPSDFTPFVRLGHLMKISVYKNPIMNKNLDEVIKHGQLIKEGLEKMPTGSGTIISKNGLILTNYHIYRMEDNIRYDKENNLLFVFKPVSPSIMVYRLKDNDPLKVPEWQFSATPIALDEERDTALFLIDQDKDGNPVSKEFSYVDIGNPFGMKLNEDITIIGYPGVGGATLTMTEGKFLGYYHDQLYEELNGIIKSNAAMSPGSSGGAALNEKAYIGIPAAVSAPTIAGSDMGYIYPVTWALKVFTVAQQKYRFSTPEIPLKWLQSDYNMDETLTDTYLTGKVVSSHSNKPVSAVIIVARRDRTLKQIKDLDEKLKAIQAVYIIQELNNLGLSIKEISDRFNVSEEKISLVLEIDLSQKIISEDVESYINGEFFFKVAQSDKDGFFIVNVPRDQNVKAYIYKDGYRLVEKDIKLSNDKSQSIRKINLYRY